MKTKEIITNAHSSMEPPRITVGEKWFRTRVATAQSKLEAAREQARLAKRRRKEAKQIARSARKQVKQAKAALAEAIKALADAVAKRAKPAGKLIKAKTGAKPLAAPRRIKAAPVMPLPITKNAPTSGPAQAGSLVEQADTGTPAPAIPAATVSESGDQRSM